MIRWVIRRPLTRGPRGDWPAHPSDRFEAESIPCRYREISLQANALALATAAFGAQGASDPAAAWERVLFLLPLVHNEGPGAAAHCRRLIDLYPSIVASSPPALRQIYEWCFTQAKRHHALLERFGRHPHRNNVLGRVSTTEEQAYLDEGDFPHQRPASA